jgi:hypothetical protein
MIATRLSEPFIGTYLTDSMFITKKESTHSYFYYFLSTFYGCSNITVRRRSGSGGSGSGNDPLNAWWKMS